MKTIARSNEAPTFKPLYLQVKERLTQSLAAGEWAPGGVIPSEQMLAARYRVAQGTVRKAIDALANDNLVVRRQGKGTFVATHTEEGQSTFRFLHIRRDDGVAEYPRSRIVDVRRGKANGEIPRVLSLKSGEAIIVIRRLLDWAKRPTVLDEITLPSTLFRGLTRAKLAAYPGSMYGFFETEFGVRMLNAHERLKAVAADAQAAKLLGVAPGTPLLSVERVARTYGERPVEFRRGLCATDAHHYANDLG
ncbi:MAG TPA: GntR family transcriptional regulator [Casimicrobiaceae bacterium]|nr:GntR family transcriptional regulator [Casimicrobiaceae bacterium]